jgi:DNA phosphorothioation-dependent restriction protein DptH
VVFDEAHKYIHSPDLVKELVETVREMRHKGMSVLVASQDPPSVPVHKFTSPAWLRHLQKANSAFGTVTHERLADLRPGEAFLWASKATDDAFTRQMMKIRTRPQLTRHGSTTKTAVTSL